MTSEPGYWMHETSGVLEPAIRSYLSGSRMSPWQIAAVRAYCRQWIMADAWDQNPHMDDEGRAWLAELRADVDMLTTRAAISGWLRRATEGGLDPL